jgi:hypothetical protein
LAADAKAKRFFRQDIICNIPEVSQAAKQGPGTPKASGPTLFVAGVATFAKSNLLLSGRLLPSCGAVPPQSDMLRRGPNLISRREAGDFVLRPRAAVSLRLLALRFAAPLASL